MSCILLVKRNSRKDIHMDNETFSHLIVVDLDFTSSLYVGFGLYCNFECKLKEGRFATHFGNVFLNSFESINIHQYRPFQSSIWNKVKPNLPI